MFMGTAMVGNASNGDDKLPVNSLKEKSAEVKTGGLIVTITVDFGRKKNGCSGRGLCSITVATEVDIAMGFYSKENGTLTLDIPEEYLMRTQPHQLPNFKDKNMFIVEEDFTFPKEVSKKMGAEGTLVVKAGSYPMRYQNSTWTIILTDLL